MRQELTTCYDPKPGVSIRSLTYEYPAGWTVPEHAHGADQLIFGIAGVMHVTMLAPGRRNLWLMPPQFAVWIPARQPHSIRMPGAVSMRTLYLRRGVVRREAMRCRVLRVSALLRELILQAVGVKELRLDDGLHQAMRALIVAEIENAPVMPTSIAMPEDGRARRMADCILADPGARGSLVALSKRAGASVRTMQRVFRQQVGSDFETWRQQARLMRAVELLVAGQSVKEVSGALGYSQIGPFIAMFRKILGVTPGAWIQGYRTETCLVQTGERKDPNRRTAPCTDLS